MTTKIMYLMDDFTGPQAGTEGQVLQLIEHLDRARYEPAMTLLRASDYIERNGFTCQVAVLGISKIASVRSILKFLHFGLMLRRRQYRIVHCFFNDVSLIAPPLLRLFGLRVLVSRRDMGIWYTPLILWALRLVSPFVARYVANSQAVKRIVEEREHVAGKRISVIYNGYFPAATTNGSASDVGVQIGSADGGPIVGIVANLRPIKRLDTLVNAFAMIHARFPLARMAIVGDCRSKQAERVLEQLEDLANQLGVRDSIIFAGSVVNPRPYINQFTVAVLCSESEGFSNSLIEYMQAARAIVCTNTGGNPELVQDGYNGFLVPVSDARALADCVIKLLSDNALARKFGEAARETVRSSYSHCRMVGEHMACYDEVLMIGRPARKNDGETGAIHRC